ncbi:MAG TPA: DUF4097 family beta strand repeat-containing protein [Steroidobacteraceae bacterium]|nr:DUF4097 family beta strand repeat-containing protein [Steroidobacteraceae bacterium]
MRTTIWLFLGVCAAGLAHADTKTFDRTVEADPHGRVEISNIAGRIEVSGWDGKEVQIHGSLGEGVDRVDVDSGHGITSIRVIVPNHTFRSASADLQVRVPRESELEVSAVSADVGETGVQGGLQLKSVSGDVKADIFKATSEIKTVSGDIVLRGLRGQTDGAELHVTTISGNIRLDHGSADFEGSTVSGDLHIRVDSTHNVRVRTTSGDIGFEGKLLHGGSIEAESVSGDVTLRATPENGYDYDLSSFSGDITDCMGVKAERTSKYGPGKRLNGQEGSAADGARIRVKTMSGDVELCNKS